MVMAGPLVEVDTLVAGINFDVNRALRAGVDTLEFLVPDRSEDDNWRILMTLTSGWDRVTTKEETRGDGSEVIVKIAHTNPTDELTTVLRAKDLHVRFNSEIYRVADVPPVAFNEAQVFELTCKIRTTRTTFDTAKGQ